MFVHAGRTKWHVQKRGSGPQMLLLHGSGASTHSFAGLMDALEEQFALIAIDLPGHGFSGDLGGASPTLGNVANAIAQLVEKLGLKPEYVIGHSAGAAIAVELAYRRLIEPKALFALNGAFYPFPGFAGQLFPAMAKLLFLNPFVPGIFAATASREKVERLLKSTGSTLTPGQIEPYGRLFASSAHVRGTLAMMANWDLSTMAGKLEKLECPVHLMIGSEDGTIDPDASIETLSQLKHGDREVFEGLGHLMHEEAPEQVSAAILRHIGTSDKTT